MPWWGVLLTGGGVSFVGMFLWTIIKTSIEDAREEKAAELREALDELEKFDE